MIKSKADRVVDRIWRVSNMVFESSVVLEYWRSAAIVPLYKGKGEKTECSNYTGTSLLSVVEKIYEGS